MFAQNIKHNKVFSVENEKARELGAKLFEAYTNHNGTDFINSIQDILNARDGQNLPVMLQAQAITYAIELSRESLAYSLSNP